MAHALRVCCLKSQDHDANGATDVHEAKRHRSVDGATPPHMKGFDLHTLYLP